MVNTNLLEARYVLKGREDETMPFSIRGLDAEKARVGVAQCTSRNVLESFGVLYEESGINNFEEHIIT